MVKNILEGPEQPEVWPAQLVKPGKALPLWIAERKHEPLLRAARLNTIVGNVEIIKTLDPPVERVSPGHTQRDC